ncbi:MAG: DnaJ C-terminal domain-containing protein [Myxococcales bacterium]
MADQTDLYDELGLARGASEDEIRRAYRKLARQHHPDVNPGKPEAEEKFKRVAAAYDVLSNKEKRALYDEFGSDGLRGGFDPEQARAYRRYQEGRSAAGSGSGQEVPFDFDLGDLFGARAARGGGAPRSHDFAMAGEDLRAMVELDFKTALEGKEVELKLPVEGPCETCAGSGAAPGSHPETCPECSGQGRVQVVRGPMKFMSTCPRCGGDGKIHAPCGTCHGSGVVAFTRDIKVRLPPGVDDGSELRVRGKGGPGYHGGPDGDLLLLTRVKPHPHFRREGLDLYLSLPVTLSEAYSGTSLSVPTPTGPVQMKVPAHSQQGARLRLKGKGVKRGQELGDLYVELHVKLPEQADDALSEALKASDALYTQPVREGITL